jgi:hypothetical protein
VAVGREESEEFVGVAAREEDERVALLDLLGVGAREWIGEAAAVDEGAQAESALGVAEANDRRGR